MFVTIAMKVEVRGKGMYSISLKGEHLINAGEAVVDYLAKRVYTMRGSVARQADVSASIYGTWAGRASATSLNGPNETSFLFVLINKY